MNDEQDILADFLQLVEAFYMPSVKVMRKELMKLKKNFEKWQDEQKSYEM